MKKLIRRIGAAGLAILFMLQFPCAAFAEDGDPLPPEEPAALAAPAAEPETSAPAEQQIVSAPDVQPEEENDPAEEEDDDECEEDELLPEEGADENAAFPPASDSMEDTEDAFPADGAGEPLDSDGESSVPEGEAIPVEPAGKDTPADTADASTADRTDETLDGDEENGSPAGEVVPVEPAGEDSPADGEKDPAAELPAPAENALTGTDAAPADGDAEEKVPSLTVGGNAVDLTTGGSGDGWRYDAEDESLVLVNYNGAAEEISTESGDLTIKAAGLNRISKLTADGDINLIGTGILLVDEIDLAEGCSFNLLTNTGIYEDGAGSVAVFLKQEDGTYLLINGSVAGLLDEEYTIPEGVTLVVPDDSTLVMQSLGVAEYLSPEGESIVAYSTESQPKAVKKLADSVGTEDAPLDTKLVEDRSTSPALTISASAKLIIKQAASLIMKRISLEHSSLTPELLVRGELELEGSVSGGVARLEAENAVSGPGSFQNSRVIVSKDQSTVTASDSSLILSDGTTTDRLTLSGGSGLQFGKDTEIGELKLEDGANVDARGHVPQSPEGNQDSLAVDTLSGEGTITYHNGNITVGENSSEGAVQEIATTAGVITYGAGTGEEETCVVGPDGLVPISDSGAELVDGYYEFPVLKVSVYGALGVDGTVRESVSGDGEDPQTIYRFGPGSEDIPLSQLKGTLLPECQGSWIEIYYMDDSGTRQKMVLTEESDPGDAALSPADICLIRTVGTTYVRHGAGGGTASETDITFTGTGILRDSDPGSVKGGTGTSILTGPKKTEPEPDPDPTPEPTPDPKPDPKPASSPTAAEQGESAQPVELWVTPEERAPGLYVLHRSVNGTEVFTLDGTAEVRMDYRPAAGQDAAKLYVVFRNTDGTLHAVRARYDAAAGKLIFTADRCGRFVVLAFDYAGEEFSNGFYEELAKTEEVGKLA